MDKVRSPKHTRCCLKGKASGGVIDNNKSQLNERRSEGDSRSGAARSMKCEEWSGGDSRNETTNCKQSEGAEMSVRTAEATGEQMTDKYVSENNE